MHFGNLREMSGKIGKDRKLKNSFGCFPDHSGCIPPAVVINVPGVFQKASEAFYNFRSWPSSHGLLKWIPTSHKVFSCVLYPFHLKPTKSQQMNKHISVDYKLYGSLPGYMTIYFLLKCCSFLHCAVLTVTNFRLLVEISRFSIPKKMPPKRQYMA